MNSITMKRCLSLAAFLALGLVATNSYAQQNTNGGNGQNTTTPIAQFTPFNVEANSGYIEHGTIYAGPYAFPSQSLVLDPANHQVGFFFGPAGNFVTNDTGSYEWSGDGSGGCLRYASFDYNKFVTNFKGLQAQWGSTSASALYEGLIKDSHSCDHDIFFGLNIQPVGKSSTQVIQRMTASAPQVVTLPNPPYPPNTKICVSPQAVFIADLSSVDTTSSRASYFTLPASCVALQVSGADNLCSAFYPQGNPCAETDPYPPLN